MKRKNLEVAKNLFLVAIGIDIVVSLTIGFHAHSTAQLLIEIESGQRVVDQYLLSNLEYWTKFYISESVTTILVGLGLVKWLNCCYGFAFDTLGIREFEHRAWTAVGWIVPIYNIFKPYKILTEIYKFGAPDWKTSVDWKKEKSSSPLLIWWIFWMIAHIVLVGIAKSINNFGIKDDVTLRQSIGFFENIVTLSALSAVVAILWIGISLYLTNRLLGRASLSAQHISAPDKRLLFVAPNMNSNQPPHKNPANVIAPVPSTPVTRNAKNNSRQLQIDEPVKFHNVAGSSNVVSGSHAIDSDDELLYDRIGRELEDGERNRALWTRVYAEENGDENKAKARYIRLRLIQLKSAIEHERIGSAIESSGAEKTESDSVLEGVGRDIPPDGVEANSIGTPLVVSDIEVKPDTKSENVVHEYEQIHGWTSELCVEKLNSLGHRCEQLGVDNWAYQEPHGAKIHVHGIINLRQQTKRIWVDASLGYPLN